MSKKVVYIDMDGVLVDLVGWVESNYLPEYIESTGIGTIVDNNAMAFYDPDPIEGAVEAFNKLAKDPRFDVYLLSTAPWANPESWKAKRIWAQEHLGPGVIKRLILTHNKALLKGDILIDDRDKNGAAEFEGEHIKFGTKPYETWTEVMKYLETI